MDEPDTFIESQRNVKARIRKKQISYRYHDPKTAVIEGVLARGDRRLANAIEAVYRMGAVFDGWTEHFNYDWWLTAFAETGVDLAFYVHRTRKADELFPWDFINAGVSKDFLRLEWERALAEQTTPNCRTNCAGCGCGCEI